MTNKRDCPHEWIQLTNEALESRLLGKGYTSWNLRGCTKCGWLEKSIGSSRFTTVPLDSDTLNEYEEEAGRRYYKALGRFAGE